MVQKIYQVDAFTDRVFGGNPACVCLLGQWLPEETMQRIALENNAPESAFLVETADGFDIRWFAPAVEVDLCGHATLASAFVLFEHEGFSGPAVRFRSRKSGVLSVKKEDGYLTLDFPTDDIRPVEPTPELAACFDLKPQSVFRGKTDYMFVYESQDQIENIVPDYDRISEIEARGIIVTAPGGACDFVSRFFCPRIGVKEDPVTGSAHTTLAPYWAGVLGKNELEAVQLSARGGYLKCRYSGERTEISGPCVLYLKGEIFI